MKKIENFNSNESLQLLFIYLFFCYIIGGDFKILKLKTHYDFYIM